MAQKQFKIDVVTFSHAPELARVFRVKGQYLMYLRVGRVSDDLSEMKMREGSP